MGHEVKITLTSNAHNKFLLTRNTISLKRLIGRTQFMLCTRMLSFPLSCTLHHVTLGKRLVTSESRLPSNPMLNNTSIPYHLYSSPVNCITRFAKILILAGKFIQFKHFFVQSKFLLLKFMPNYNIL